MFGSLEQNVRNLTPWEFVLIYTIFALFFSFMGFIYADVVNEVPQNDIDKIIPPGISFIFFNNIVFFLLVCVLPFLNFVAFAAQFWSIGSSIYLVHVFSAEVQFALLYRHAVFEVIALLVSVYVSYSLYDMLLGYLHNSIKFSKKNYLVIGISVAFVLFLTLVGAFLEGTVNV